MRPWAETFVAEAARGLAAAAVPADAGAMTRYMRNQFPFLGVKAQGLRTAVKAALAAAGTPVGEDEVVEAIDLLWVRSEREYRYAGCELAGRFAKKASPAFVGQAARWITTDPWWDTCDSLARRSVGQVVRGNEAMRATMDLWLAGDNLWLTRSALLHMGGWKEAIDRDWVFAACVMKAEDPEFFIRKAIGWILRDLAWVDPAAVTTFIGGPGAVLSPLSKREALKNVSGARTAERLRRVARQKPGPTTTGS